MGRDLPDHLLIRVYRVVLSNEHQQDCEYFTDLLEALDHIERNRKAPPLDVEPWLDFNLETCALVVPNK